MKLVNNKENYKIKKSDKGKEIETLKIVLNENLPKPTRWDENKIWSFGYHKAILGYLNAILIIVLLY